MHGAVFVQSLARKLLDEGFSKRQVFGGTGLSPDIMGKTRPFAPLELIAGFYEHAADLTGNDIVGFEHGLQSELRRAGMLAYVGMSAPTARDFLLNLARYRRVFSDALEIDADAIEADGQVKWRFSVPSRVRRRQLVEFGAAGLIHDLRRTTNRELRPASVAFRHARNSNTDVIERYFGCPVQFGALDNTCDFRPEDLKLPLMTADDELYSVLRECCEKALKDMARKAPPLVVEVERVLSERMSRGQASQDVVARALGMSSRTLSRRLADEGTTFHKTLDGLRQALAETYLKDSNLSLGQVAYLLGYSGHSSFSDAFKRWQGVTPGRYRLA